MALNPHATTRQTSAPDALEQKIREGFEREIACIREYHSEYDFAWATRRLTLLFEMLHELRNVGLVAPETAPVEVTVAQVLDRTTPAIAVVPDTTAPVR